ARRIPVAMTGGNHDRWGGTFWREDAGIEFGPHQVGIELESGAVQAIHGDGLHEERPGASWMHRATSSSLVIGAFRLLHPDAGFWVADRLGHNLDYGIANPGVVEAAAARQLRWAAAHLESRPELRALVMGHTHRAACHEVRPGRWYLNPGAWLDGHRYGILDSTGGSLHEFE
ncbi:MAG TPA: hypothetical protein PLL69_06940, partial [Gemmatimonadales bacterium]|nr:hypothetical protein [Gemmatimonadales bacterium]